MTIDIEKFKRHCNLGVDIELENDDGVKDKFTLKPLSAKQFVEFNYIAEKYNNSDITPEDTDKMMDLFIDVIKRSYPELEYDIAENFALNNLADFMLVMNKLAPRMDERKLKQLETMKKLQEAKVIKPEDNTKTN